MSLPQAQALIHRLSDDALLVIFEAYYGILQDHFTLSDTLCLSGHRAAYWLNLSKQSKLFINIYSSFHPIRDKTFEEMKAEEARIVQLAQILQPCIDRWNTLSIELDDQDVDLFFQHCSTNNHVPNLKMLDAFFIEGIDYTRPAPRLWNVPYDLPPNSTVGVSVCCSNRIPTFASTFGWAITSVSVTLKFITTTANSLLDVLQSCPNVKKVEFHTLTAIDDLEDHSLDIPFTESTEPIILRSLRQCRILLPSVGDGNRLIRRLILPQVEALHVANARFDVAYPVVLSSSQLHDPTLENIYGPTSQILFLPTLTSLYIRNSTHLLEVLRTPQLADLRLRGSATAPHSILSAEPLRCLAERSPPPPLRTLFLQHVEINDEGFIWCMERLTELESLKLIGSTLTNATFLALAKPLQPSSDGPSWILPRLTKIYIWRNKSIGPPAFIEFISSRSGICLPQPCYQHG
ncbi:hypothetical protein BOTBODRAFT_148643 [Botryobasidium botryosum FD-172 SS1]|uniref:F-box domain-containing protein n=1 Tax=Botryobasidium botryosum (strain FD-172 SS1) TaxID=930990 RepID=A0A067M9J6_BOTB1|nr:hypothetical protein BOTBODRAFT_148643 [Botryobasidium botryosum FD-172 SS1]